VRGYACLVFARHAVELHDLNEAEAAAFMRDMRRVSAAAAAITNPVKMNYEVHGNTAPHLHVHFFPRYQGDQFEGGPINPRIAKRPAYAPGEFEQFRERLQTALVLPNTGLKLSAPAPKESGGRPEMGCCTIPFVNVLIRRRSLSAIR
jgi:diadenosine tetraphosphate (Ap4A) HIT family hydrolase